MSMYRVRSWLLVGAIVAVALIGAWLLKPLLTSTEPPSLQSGQLYPQPKALAPFALTDQHGQPFTPAALVGKWSFVFFGYTTCPDICPTTLTMFTQLYKQLPPAMQDDTQIVFVSLDPARDTVAQLSAYMPFFHPRFIGVTADEKQIDTFARDMGVAYAKVEQPAGGYLVDHSVRIFLLNPRGERYALFAPTQGSGFVASTLQGDYLRIRTGN